MPRTTVWQTFVTYLGSRSQIRFNGITLLWLLGEGAGAVAEAEVEVEDVAVLSVVRLTTATRSVGYIVRPRLGSLRPS